MIGLKWNVVKGPPTSAALGIAATILCTEDKHQTIDSNSFSFLACTLSGCNIKKQSDLTNALSKIDLGIVEGGGQC